MDVVWAAFVFFAGFAFIISAVVNGATKILDSNGKAMTATIERKNSIADEKIFRKLNSMNRDEFTFRKGIPSRECGSIVINNNNNHSPNNNYSPNIDNSKSSNITETSDSFKKFAKSHYFCTKTRLYDSDNEVWVPNEWKNLPNETKKIFLDGEPSFSTKIITKKSYIDGVNCNEII